MIIQQDAENRKKEYTMKKKLLILVLVSALALVMGACGADPAEEQNEQDTDAKATETETSAAEVSSAGAETETTDTVTTDMKMKLFIDDQEVLRAMSPDVAHTIKLSFKTDGSVRANAKMVDEEGFRLLIQHAMAAAAKIADGIQQGKTEIAPVSMSGFCSCDRCDWRALCQQDPRLGGMPRTLPAMQQSDVLRQIRAERDMEE